MFRFPVRQLPSFVFRTSAWQSSEGLSALQAYSLRMRRCRRLTQLYVSFGSCQPILVLATSSDSLHSCPTSVPFQYILNCVCMLAVIEGRGEFCFVKDRGSKNKVRHESLIGMLSHLYHPVIWP